MTDLARRSALLFLAALVASSLVACSTDSGSNPGASDGGSLAGAGGSTDGSSNIGNGGDGHETGTVANATVSNNVVIDALYNGVGFSASNDIIYQGNTVNHPGLDGIVISPPFYPAPAGSATIRDNRVINLNSGRTAFKNLSSGYTATLSGNNW